MIFLGLIVLGDVDVSGEYSSLTLYPVLCKAFWRI